MHRLLAAPLTGVLLTALAAAPAAAQNLITKINLDTVVVQGNSEASMYRASAPRTWDITHTRVALSFDLPARVANGQAWIKIHPIYTAQDTLRLDAKGMKFSKFTVMLKGKPVTFSQDYANNQLRFRFDRKLSPRDTVELYIAYTTHSYEKDADDKEVPSDERGIYFINTDKKIPGKPVQVWTQGETEENSRWLPTIDKPNERFTAQIELTVPDSFKTMSNGVLISGKPVGGMRTDIWKMDKTVQAYAYAFAIGNYALIRDSWQGKEVNYYVEPAYAPYAKLIFNHTPDMLTYFSQITGIPYPWNKYSQAVVRDYVSGAMENTTATIFGEFVNQNARQIKDHNYEDIVAHELFHQWFGDYVTAESWSNLTVNESFANYSEQLWRRHYYGDVSADELAWTDLQTYVNQTSENDAPLVRFYYNDRQDMFDRISYEKGGAVLRYMHNIMGDSAFFRAMRIYLTKNAYQNGEAHNWRMAVEEATGEDWNWYFNQFYYRAGHPVLRIQYRYDDEDQKLTVTVRQASQPDSNLVYNLPLTGALVGSDGSYTPVDWKLTKKREQFVYDYVNGERPVFIPDTKHLLPGVIKEEGKKPAEYLAQMKGARDLISKRLAMSGVTGNPNDSKSLEVFRLALADTTYQVRTRALQQLQRQSSKKWRDALTERVVDLASNDTHNETRAAALTVMGSWKVKGHDEMLRRAVADSSYLVAGAAISALAATDSIAAYELAKRIINENPKDDLEEEAWSAITNLGRPEDIELFSSRAGTFYGQPRIRYVVNLLRYAIETKDNTSFERAMELMTSETTTEAIPGYRNYMGSFVTGILNYYRKQAKDDDNSAEDRRLAKARITIAEKFTRELISKETNEDNRKALQSQLDARTEREDSDSEGGNSK